MCAPALLSTHWLLASGCMALFMLPEISVRMPMVSGVLSTLVRRLPVHTGISGVIPIERIAATCTAAPPRSLPGGTIEDTLVTARSR